MSETDLVLKANEAFYSAFRDRDFSAMEKIWARRVPVSCIHPGWALINDRATIVESWKAILENSEYESVAAVDEEVTFYGDAALVVCFEQIGEGELIASNLFVKEDGQWRLAHHQAGPLTGYERADDDDHDDLDDHDDHGEPGDAGEDDEDGHARTIH